MSQCDWWPLITLLTFWIGLADSWTMKTDNFYGGENFLFPYLKTTAIAIRKGQWQTMYWREVHNSLCDLKELTPAPSERVLKDCNLWGPLIASTIDEFCWVGTHHQDHPWDIAETKMISLFVSHFLLLLLFSFFLLLFHLIFPLFQSKQAPLRYKRARVFIESNTSNSSAIWCWFTLIYFKGNFGILIQPSSTVHGWLRTPGSDNIFTELFYCFLLLGMKRQQ